MLYAVNWSPYPPKSPPAHERGQNVNHWTVPWEKEQYQYQPENQHTRGVAVDTSGICGNPNQSYQGDCGVCGKSFDTVKEEITFDYLERTRMTDVTYLARLRGRKALQAGMVAGSFILVPGGVSQAAACDGNHYQIVPTICLFPQEYCHYRPRGPKVHDYD